MKKLSEIVLTYENSVKQEVETQEKSVTPTGVLINVVPDTGKYLSKVSVSGDANLVAGKIKRGEVIYGIIGTFNGSDHSIIITSFDENGSPYAIDARKTTKLWNNIFYGNPARTILLNNNIDTIPDSAFDGCSSLQSITIPNSVTSIGGGAFDTCTGLTSITIPNSVTSIGSSVFNGCTSLQSITIPNSVTSIGGSVFRNCTSLQSITIPNSVTSIGSSVFYGCTGLTSATISNSVSLISSNVFRSCSALNYIFDLSGKITGGATQSSSPLYTCTALITVQWGSVGHPVGTQTYYNLFNKCTALTTINIYTVNGTIIAGAPFGCTNAGLVINWYDSETGDLIQTTTPNQ